MPQPGAHVDEYTTLSRRSKYQFGAAAASFDGAKLAEALASRRDLDDDAQLPEGDTVQPAWAAKMTPSEAFDATFQFSGSCRRHSVRITNAYRTWEQYYAAVLPHTSAGREGSIETAPEAAFEIVNPSGVLAPRGGANNVCDPTKPYRRAT